MVTTKVRELQEKPGPLTLNRITIFNPWLGIQVCLRVNLFKLYIDFQLCTWLAPLAPYCSRSSVFAYDYSQLLALTISDFPLNRMHYNGLLQFSYKQKLAMIHFYINAGKKTFPCHICSVTYEMLTQLLIPAFLAWPRSKNLP